MSDDKINVSEFDLNNRERIVNTENEVKYQRKEIDKLTSMSEENIKQVDYIKRLMVKFSTFAKNATNSIKNLQKRCDDFDVFYEETQKTLNDMEILHKEIKEYMNHQKELYDTIESKSDKKNSFIDRFRNMEKWMWMMIGGLTLVGWMIGMLLKELGVDGIMKILGM